MPTTSVFISLTFVLFSCNLISQELPVNEQEYLEEYDRRIKKEVLYGVYIPVDLEDGFRELNRLSSPEGLEKFRSAPEDSIRTRLHFGLGGWISHNWGFYGGSRLSHHLKEQGLTFPDDMVQLIIVSYHRKLHGKDLGLKEQILAFQEKRKKEHEERQKKKKVISEQTRIRKN